MIKYINQQVQEGLNEATTQQILGKTKQKGKGRAGGFDARGCCLLSF